MIITLNGVPLEFECFITTMENPNPIPSFSELSAKMLLQEERLNNLHSSDIALHDVAFAAASVTEKRGNRGFNG